MPTKPTNRRSPHVPERVHIVPIGYEEDRVVLPLLEMKAERVILLANNPSQDKAAKFRERVVERLDASDIAHEVRTAAIFSLPETLALFVRILREFRAENLAINISAGSKIQGLAGCLAAMLVRTEGIPVTVYYVEPKRYREDPPRTPLSFGIEQIVEIAAITLPTPPLEIKMAMQVLARKPCSKLDLAVLLAEKGCLDKSKLNEAGKPKDERARVSLQSAIDQRVVQPLVTSGHATAQRKGRHVIVTLTESGKQVSSLLTAGMD